MAEVRTNSLLLCAALLCGGCGAEVHVATGPIPKPARVQPRSSLEDPGNNTRAVAIPPLKITRTGEITQDGQVMVVTCLGNDYLCTQLNNKCTVLLPSGVWLGGISIRRFEDRPEGAITVLIQDVGIH